VRVILKIFTDRIAEIIIDDSEPIPDAMDCARTLLVCGITAAKITGKPATGTPATNVAHNEKDKENDNAKVCTSEVKR
jgi:hypothetical protein